MSERFKSAVHCVVHEVVCEALGEPDMVAGRNDHWSLKPYPSGAPINVLLDGYWRLPVMWVFDPHDHRNGMIHEVVRSEPAIWRFVESIKDRLKLARERAPRIEPRSEDWQARMRSDSSVVTSGPLHVPPADLSHARSEATGGVYPLQLRVRRGSGLFRHEMRAAGSSTTTSAAASVSEAS